MACISLILKCVVISLAVTFCWKSTAAAQFDDQFDLFDDSFFEPGPPYLGDVVKNVPRIGRRNDFFLKAAKSVPRIGRRNDFFLRGGPKSDSGIEGVDIFRPPVSKNIPRVGRRNDFFLKAAKSVPRIGRRNDFFLKAAKSVPRIGRRDDDYVPAKRSDVSLTTAVGSGEMSAWPWFRNPDLIPRAFKRSELLNGWHSVEPDLRERNSGLVLYDINLHKELEEPRHQAEV